MAEFYPFRAIRPAEGRAASVACLPYDVLSDEQARKLAENRESFVHVIRSEIDLPDGTDPYSNAVYERAGANLEQLLQSGSMIQEDHDCYYLYRESTDTHVQTGFVGTVLCRQYDEGVIRRHELTVPEKEDDRTRHILATGAQTGPVFLAFERTEQETKLIESVTQREPVYDFLQDGVRHQVWVIASKEEVEAVKQLFESIPVLYIADGHHRAASSCRAAKEQNAGDNEEAGRFMAVAFAAEDLAMLGYHRFVKDLNGLDKEAFLQRIGKDFTVTAAKEQLPEARHVFCMHLGDVWYTLEPNADLYNEGDSISRLDVSILQEKLLAPVLGIKDPRRDARIIFVGGEDALKEISALADTYPEGVAFLLYPTAIQDLLAVANEHRIMPPKSTWFEPKLLSGLFVHRIDS